MVSLKVNLGKASNVFISTASQIDCFGEGRSICENRFNVHSWPQLKVFRKGQYAGEYSGNQDKGNIGLRGVQRVF